MSFQPAPLPVPDADAAIPYGSASVRVLSGKVARALFSPTYNISEASVGQLNADQLKDLTADTIAKVMFYSNGLWPYQLVVDQVDSNGMPCEYSIADPVGKPVQIAIPDETLIVAQAACDWFFFEFKDKKVSEEISDEGQKWTYALSPNVLTAWSKQLIADRDRALEVIASRYDYLTEYISFLGERDPLTSALVEWWVRPGLTYPSGQEIFPDVAAFGG